jgi:lipoate-protein ligase A
MLTRVAVFAPGDGPENFALDEALTVRAAQAGDRLVRVYGWTRPTISLGRNEVALGRFSAERLAAEGLDLVRRPTGGRALVHDHELTYAIAGPARRGESARARYIETQQLLARALRVLGAGAGIADSTHIAPQPDTACFAAPTAGELVIGARKLAAGAQWRHATAWLQHGSILLRDDQPRLRRVLAPGASLPALPPAATLADVLGREPTRAAFADALVRAVEQAGEAAHLVHAEDFALEARAFIGRYRDEQWTWRR